MDIVYVFRNGKRKSIELRYSLMFLANLPHNRVYIVWDLPPFVKDVIHIPFKDWANKIQNVKNKYKLIIEMKTYQMILYSCMMMYMLSNKYQK